MKEYISREAAIKSTWMILEGMGYPRSENRPLERTVEAVFQSAPAADVVEVVRGKWEMNSNYPDRFICSECGAQFDCWHWEAKQMHYCPSCGAKMDGGQDK